jgi:hypothetical protein
MNIRSIFLLIISIILVVVSSWNVSIFVRLDKASPLYVNSDQLSKNYVNSGKNVSIGVLILSIILMIVSSISIYKDFVRLA